MARSSSERTAVASDSQLRPLGSAPGYQWLVDAGHVDMSRPGPKPRLLTIKAQPQTITVDLRRTAMIVVDMQNDFCAEDGWVDQLGVVDFTPDRSPIGPLQHLLPALRAVGLHVIWVSGFWDTPLDSILHNLRTKTVLFGGVNIDQSCCARCRTRTSSATAAC